MTEPGAGPALTVLRSTTVDGRDDRPEGEAAVAIEGLVRRRAKGDARFTLRVPSLTVERGEIAGVIGPSGCGKSTLLDLLALVLRPHEATRFAMTTGEGREVDVSRLWRGGGDRGLARFRRRHMGYILQTGGLFPFLTVGRNARLPFTLAGRRPDRAAIAETAERLGIGDLLKRKPGALSGGQRQRAAVLRAIATAPAFILADEPTAALDQRNAASVVAQLAELVRERGATAIVVTHQPELLEGIADRWVTFDLSYPEPGHTVSTCAQHRVH